MTFSLRHRAPFRTSSLSDWLREANVTLAFAAMFVPALGTIQVAQAQAFSILHKFAGPPSDGSTPNTGLLRDSAGNMYGTTRAGGTFNAGTIFKLDPAGNETVLFNFKGGSEGATPTGVVRDAAGNTYGATATGGVKVSTTCPSGCGLVYKIDPLGNFTVLHEFSVADGASPGALTIDAGGNLYGPASYGGPNCLLDYCGGTIFKIDSSGSFTVLHTFPANGPGSPNGPLVLDESGNIYGTAFSVVFKLDPAGNFSVLYSLFTGLDGGNVTSALFRDSGGNLYGTTSFGGDSNCNAGNGCGTIFKVDKNGNATLLYNFEDSTDGGYPATGVIVDAKGNVYGTAFSGGAPTCGGGCGVVFRVDPAGNERALHAFTNQDDAVSPGFDGSGPSLVRDEAGNLYGTAAVAPFGGNTTFGTVFKVARQEADLLLQAGAPSGSGKSHSFYTYTFNIINLGPDFSEWPRLVAHVPYGTVFHNYTMSAPGYCTTPAENSRGEVVCRYRGALSPYGSAWTVTLTVWAWAPPGSVITETAATMAGTHDPNWSNNTFTYTTPLQ